MTKCLIMAMNGAKDKVFYHIRVTDVSFVLGDFPKAYVKLYRKLHKVTKCQLIGSIDKNSIALSVCSSSRVNVLAA